MFHVTAGAAVNVQPYVCLQALWLYVSALKELPVALNPNFALPPTAYVQGIGTAGRDVPHTS